MSKIKYSKGKLLYGSYSLYGQDSESYGIMCFYKVLSFVDFYSHKLCGTVNYGSFINQQCTHKSNKTLHQTPEGGYLIN